jgi:hypothetical protein
VIPVRHTDMSLDEYDRSTVKIGIREWEVRVSMCGRCYRGLYRTLTHRDRQTDDYKAAAEYVNREKFGLVLIQVAPLGRLSMAALALPLHFTICRAVRVRYLAGVQHPLLCAVAADSHHHDDSHRSGPDTRPQRRGVFPTDAASISGSHVFIRGVPHTRLAARIDFP